MNSSMTIGFIIIITGFALLYMSICSFKEEKERILKLDFYKSLDKEQCETFDRIYKKRLSLMKTQIIFSMLMPIFGVSLIIFSYFNY